MTHQEIFNRVVTHLLTQKKRSINAGGCAYRDGAGNSCAAGCLIPDEHYTRAIEHHVVGDECVNEILAKSLGVEALSPTDIAFLRELQKIHDGYPPSNWGTVLETFGNRLGLSFSAQPVSPDEQGQEIPHTTESAGESPSTQASKPTEAQ